MFTAIFSFLYTALKKAGEWFSGIPSRLAVLLAGLGAVVSEIVAFVDDVVVFFEGKMETLQGYFSRFADSVNGSDLFGLFCYSFAFDHLVTIVADVVSFVVMVLTFLFVGLVHVVLIFFGLRFGYNCYKYLVRSFTNGISKA